MTSRHPSAVLAAPMAYPLAAPACVRMALALPLLLALLLQLAWWRASAPLWWQQGLALASCAVAAAVVLRLPLWQAGTFLHWSGSKWRLQAGRAAADDTALASLAVMMDGQSWLLLRARELQPPGRIRWLWLARGTNPERWPDIRRVLYSSIADDQHNIPAV